MNRAAAAFSALAVALPGAAAPAEASRGSGFGPEGVPAVQQIQICGEQIGKGAVSAVVCGSQTLADEVTRINTVTLPGAAQYDIYPDATHTAAESKITYSSFTDGLREGFVRHHTLQAKAAMARSSNMTEVGLAITAGSLIFAAAALGAASLSAQRRPQAYPANQIH